MNLSRAAASDGGELWLEAEPSRGQQLAHRPVRHGALDHHPAEQSDQADTFVGGGMSG